MAGIHLSGVDHGCNAPYHPLLRRDSDQPGGTDRAEETFLSRPDGGLGRPVGFRPRRPAFRIEGQLKQLAAGRVAVSVSAAGREETGTCQVEDSDEVPPLLG
jgi:hypothetical protein